MCSAHKAAFVRELGASATIDHAGADAFDGSHAYDLIVDIAGNATLRRLRRALTPRARAVLVGTDTGGVLLDGVQRNLWAALSSPFIGPTFTGFISRERPDDLDVLVERIAAGGATPAVHGTYPLVAAADALHDLAAGRVRGKNVITI